MAVCVRLEGDSPLVEEFELPLWLAAGRGFLAWHSVGDDGAVRGGFFRFLSQFVVV